MRTFLRDLLVCLLLFVPLAGVVSGLWMLDSRQETNTLCNLVGLQERTVVTPFVYRRLAADASYALWRATPETWWTSIADRLWAKPAIRDRLVSQMGWTRAATPRLLAHGAILFASVLAFSQIMVAWIRRLYLATPLVVYAVAALTTLLLLGGVGAKSTWANYPYDLPHVACVALVLWMALRGSWLVVPAIALAAYSKETALLAIPCAFLIWPGSRRAAGFVAGSMLFAYAAVQIAIRLSIHSPRERSFQFVSSNIVDLVGRGSWTALAFVVLIVWIIRHRHAYPVALRRCLWLVPAIAALAFFKGWLMELRQYAEALPIFGPCAIQAMLIELGYGNRLVARPSETAAIEIPSTRLS